MDVGIEVGYVMGITMTKTGSGKAKAIVIDDHRTEDDLIASVPIDIGNGVVMIALPVPRTGRVAIPAPTLHELVGSRIDIEGNELMTRVDTTTQEDAGLLAIEIGRAEEVLRTAVAITIAPSILDEVVVSRTAEKMTRVLALLETRQRIVDALIGLSSLSIDIEQELGTAVHKPVGTATCSCSIVERSVTDDIGRAISHMDGGAVSSAENTFCTTIAIPVVGYDVLLIVLEVAHVGSTVDPPEYSTIELHTFEERILSVVAVLWITGTDLALVIIFNKDLEFAITIHVGHADVVGYVGGGKRSVMLRHDFEIVLCPNSGSSGGLLFYPTNDSTYGIGVGSVSFFHQQIGN